MFCWRFASKVLRTYSHKIVMIISLNEQYFNFGHSVEYYINLNNRWILTCRSLLLSAILSCLKQSTRVLQKAHFIVWVSDWGFDVTVLVSVTVETYIYYIYRGHYSFTQVHKSIYMYWHSHESIVIILCMNS